MIFEVFEYVMTTVESIEYMSIGWKTKDNTELIDYRINW